MAEKYENALITGATSGIGRGLAAWFARRGTRVYACGRREAELSSLRDEVTGAGGRLEVVVMDVTKSRETIEQIQRVDEACGGLDLVVANAGIGTATPAKKMKWEVVEQMIGVNVTGAAATLCAVLPKMVERNRGHLVGVSSIAAYRGMSLMAGYSASKAYLATFCESLRVDLARTKVAVSAIHPGYVKSEMTANNTFWMPFLMETDAAVEGIGRAILREAREFVIPWQWRPTMRALRMVPNAAWDGLARKLR
ncbi:MAG TPA: SDR family NAD(P)-dependent oxidoreductase [Myxococcaceae bacterium]|nr:SDR family NAD(P)-dependent oxidoreductase [Myxococcaceae bacterium]